MALVLNETHSTQNALTALQRIDSEITDVVGTASQAVVYSYDPITEEWMRMEIEGPLFVVKRTGNPRFKMIVMNRLNTNNMEQDIDDSFQAELVDNYFMFRCAENVESSNLQIHGLWFSRDGDQETIVDCIERVMRAIQRTAAAPVTFNTMDDGGELADDGAEYDDYYDDDAGGEAVAMDNGEYVDEGVQYEEEAYNTGEVGDVYAVEEDMGADEQQQTEVVGKKDLASILKPSTLKSSAPVSKVPPAAPTEEPKVVASASALSSILGKGLGKLRTSSPPLQRPEQPTSVGAAVPGVYTPGPRLVQPASEAAILAASHQDLNDQYVLTKKQLKLALVSLLGDDRFLEVIHAEYKRQVQKTEEQNDMANE